MNCITKQCHATTQTHMLTILQHQLLRNATSNVNHIVAHNYNHINFNFCLTCGRTYWIDKQIHITHHYNILKIIILQNNSVQLFASNQSQHCIFKNQHKFFAIFVMLNNYALIELKQCRTCSAKEEWLQLHAIEWPATASVNRQRPDDLLASTSQMYWCKTCTFYHTETRHSSHSSNKLNVPQSRLQADRT